MFQHSMLTLDVYSNHTRLSNQHSNDTCWTCFGTAENHSDASGGKTHTDFARVSAQNLVSWYFEPSQPQRITSQLSAQNKIMQTLDLHWNHKGQNNQHDPVLRVFQHRTEPC